MREPSIETLEVLAQKVTQRMREHHIKFGTITFNYFLGRQMEIDGLSLTAFESVRKRIGELMGAYNAN